MALLTELYKYQQKGAAKLARFLDHGGGALLADEQGLGKTIQVLAYYDAVHEKYRERPAVVVCQAGLRYNWQNEFRFHLGVHAEIIEGREADPDRLDGGKIFVVSYDTIGDVRQKTSWAYCLARRKPWLVVLDESQAIMHRATKRTKRVLAFGRKIPRRIATTGTPLMNRIAELWPVLNFLRPDVYPSFTPFAMKHCKPERKPWGWEFKGAERVDELHEELLMTMMIRRLKADVLKDLPPKVRKVVPLPLSSRREYEDAHQDFMKWMRKNHRHRVGRAKKAQVLVKTGYLLRLAGMLKLKAVVAWVRAWLTKRPGKKIILFGKHAELLRRLHEAFKCQSVLVTGATPMKKRKEGQALFQKSDRYRVFVGNIDAAGAGWNGTAASAVAFVEYDWRPGMHKQCEDRAHRIGQHETVRCYYLTARATIEEKLAQVIQDKQAVLDQVLDGGDVPDQMTVFDQLLEDLE